MLKHRKGNVKQLQLWLLLWQVGGASSPARLQHGRGWWPKEQARELLERPLRGERAHLPATRQSEAAETPRTSSMMVLNGTEPRAQQGGDVFGEAAVPHAAAARGCARRLRREVAVSNRGHR